MRRLVALSLLAALTVPVTAASGALLPQDDAGSGGDAPGVPTASFRIDEGVVYSGTIEGKTGGDSEDWYVFDANAGDAIEARTAAPVGCVAIHDAAGTELGGACAIAFAEFGTATAVAPATGTYYLRWYHNQPTINDTVPQPYRFALGVGEPALAPVPVDSAGLFLPPASLAPVAPAAPADEQSSSPSSTPV